MHRIYNYIAVIESFRANIFLYGHSLNWDGFSLSMSADCQFCNHLAYGSNLLQVLISKPFFFKIEKEKNKAT